MNPQKSPESKSRLVIATSLFVLSILASFLFSYTSHMGEKYWVLTHNLTRGEAISQSDLVLTHATLGTPSGSYVKAHQSITGAVATRNLRAGEFISLRDLAADIDDLSLGSLSLSIRAVDIPNSISAGDVVSLYQVEDSRNGEDVVPPVEILAAAYVEEVARKSANFASDISLTISIPKQEVLRVLAASSKGRIVVVASHG